MKFFNIYLDAAGDPGWPHPFGKSVTKHYILAGLALTPQQELEVRRETDRIKTKYGLYEVELKYRPLIYGDDSYKSLTDQQRKSIADEIFDLISKTKPVLFATVVKKMELKIKHGANAIYPKEYALRATVGRISKFLIREDAVSPSIIMDEEEYRKDKVLQRVVHHARRAGIQMAGWGYQPLPDRLDRFLNVITFLPSETSPSIQLVDFCVHSIFKHFERAKSKRYLQLEPLFDRSNGRVWEPSIVPH